MGVGRRFFAVCDMVLVTVIVAAAVSAVLVPVTRLAAVRWEIIDVPNHRSSHDQPIPRGAGIAIGIAAASALALYGSSATAAALIGSSAALGIVGLLDDRQGLSVRARLGAQVLVAAVVCSIIVSANSSGAWLAVAIVGAVIGTVGYVNAFNFMDGINGISAAQAIVAGGAFAILGLLDDIDILTYSGAAIAASFIGFLPYNVPIARVFLGDVGSYFGGCWLALLAVVAASDGVPVEVAVAPFLYYIADTSITLGSLVRRGHRAGEPHRDHAYQRLSRRWGTHSAVSGAVALVIAVDSAIMISARHEVVAIRASAFAVAVLTAVGFVVYGRRPGTERS